MAGAQGPGKASLGKHWDSCLVRPCNQPSFLKYVLNVQSTGRGPVDTETDPALPTRRHRGAVVALVQHPGHLRGGEAQSSVLS